MCAGLSHELASRGTQAIGSSTADPLALKHSKRHVTLAVVVLYWVGTAMSYAYLEGWTMVDSLYAIFITYTTIGLGDFVPEPNLEYAWSIEVLVGLSLFAALIQAETQAVEEAEHDAEERALKEATGAEGRKGTTRAELL